MLSGETAIGHDPVLVVRDDGAHRGARRVRGQLPPLGAAPRVRAADVGGRRLGPHHARRVPRRVAGRPRRRGDGDPVLHAQRAHGPGDRPLPPGVPARRAVAGSAHRERRCRCCGASRRCRSRRTRRATRWSGSRSRPRCTTASSSTVTSSSCWPARPTARPRRRPTCCGSSRSRDDAALVGGGRCARRAADRPRARVARPLGRAAQAVAPARRPLPGAALRPSRLRPLDAPRRTVRHRRPGRRPRRRCSTAVRPSCSGTASAATSRWPSPTGTRSWSGPSASTRRRCRGSTGGRPATAGGEAATASDDPADAAERFMRRMVGDEKWMRLPAGTRAARRTEGVTMVGELADLQRRRAVGPGADRRAGRGDARVGRPRAPPPLDVVPRARCCADCPVVTIEGARHFGPNTHPDAVAAVARRAGHPSGERDRDVAAEERARRRVGGAGRQRLTDLVGAVLQRLALPPHDGGDADEDGDRDELADDPLDDDRRTRRRARPRRRRSPARRRGPW